MLILVQGWRNPKGDEYYDIQRKRADRASKRKQKHFYESNKKVGIKLEEVGAFSILDLGESQPQVLNLCMAPGGYTWSLLQLYPSAQISGITLPGNTGGHGMLLPYGKADPRIQVKFMDITLLALEFCKSGTPIHPRHPEAEKFYAEVPYKDQTFHIVLCDGQVLRTHERADYRQKLEPLRLTVSQLIFGMRRVRAGGTFIILLHRVDAWESLKLLSIFRRFSIVQLFKPDKIWKERSSFYFIAKEIQPGHPAAISAIENWRHDWWTATFGGETGTGEQLEVDELAVMSVLTSLETELLDMARPIWEVQLNSMERAPYTQ